MRKYLGWAVTMLVASLVAGCSAGTVQTAVPAPPTATASSPSTGQASGPVLPSGSSLTGPDGVTLIVPPGAVTEPTSGHITALPDGYDVHIDGEWKGSVLVAFPLGEVPDDHVPLILHQTPDGQQIEQTVRMGQFLVARADSLSTWDLIKCGVKLAPNQVVKCLAKNGYKDLTEFLAKKGTKIAFDPFVCGDVTDIIGTLFGSEPCSAGETLEDIQRYKAQASAKASASASPTPPRMTSAVPLPPSTTAPAPAPAPRTTVAAPPPQTTAPSVRVDAYANYGPVTTAGTPMCAGNPARPESMPGGTVVQSFPVPAGVARLDQATVQIDPNPALVVHATLEVNGTARASAAAAPAGDTTFRFSSVAVRAGDTVWLRLTWSGAGGKLDTIYLTGNPAGAVSVTNTCSDGAPTYTRSDTGLRAVVGGWSS